MGGLDDTRSRMDKGQVHSRDKLDDWRLDWVLWTAGYLQKIDPVLVASLQVIMDKKKTRIDRVQRPVQGWWRSSW